MVTCKINMGVSSLSINFPSLQSGCIFTRKARNLHYLTKVEIPIEFPVAAAEALRAMQDWQLEAEISFLLFVCYVLSVSNQ